jgi:transcriptional regulator with XRE-family HTH domain
MDDMTKKPPPAETSAVLQYIQKTIKKQGFTAYSLSKKTGLGISTVQRVIDSEVSPSLATLETIAKALGLVIEVKPAPGI